MDVSAGIVVGNEISPLSSCNVTNKSTSVQRALLNLQAIDECTATTRLRRDELYTLMEVMLENHRCQLIYAIALFFSLKFYGFISPLVSLSIYIYGISVRNYRFYHYHEQ
jgi:hypothetical protein